MEGQGGDARGQRLAAHHQADLGPEDGLRAPDIAHGDGRADARPESAGGDAPDDRAGGVDDFAALAGGRAAGGRIVTRRGRGRSRVLVVGGGGGGGGGAGGGLHLAEQSRILLEREGQALWEGRE